MPTDHSELAKLMASASDVSKKASAEIGALLEKLSELAATLDTVHPQLSGVHKAIVSATPDAPIPGPEEEPVVQTRAEARAEAKEAKAVEVQEAKDAKAEAKQAKADAKAEAQEK